MIQFNYICCIYINSSPRTFGWYLEIDEEPIIEGEQYEERPEGMG